MPIKGINDIQIYYESAGEGPPILFIHGLGSSGRDWEEQLPAFVDDYRVITYDVRGHGRTTRPPGPYSVPMFARDAAALIRALGLSPVHTVGISMGGMIGFQLALDAPDLVRSLVIANSGPELVVTSLKDRLQIVQRVLIVRLMGMRKMGEVLAERLFPDPAHGALRHEFARRWAQNDTRAYLAAMRALVGWSIADRLAEITCPTLVLAADQDYTPVAAKEAYVAKIPHAELVVIENSRHATPAERPEQFNQAVRGYIDSLA